MSGIFRKLKKTLSGRDDATPSDAQESVEKSTPKAPGSSVVPGVTPTRPRGRVTEEWRPGASGGAADSTTSSDTPEAAAPERKPRPERTPREDRPRRSRSSGSSDASSDQSTDRPPRKAAAASRSQEPEGGETRSEAGSGEGSGDGEGRPRRRRRRRGGRGRGRGGQGGQQASSEEQSATAEGDQSPPPRKQESAPSSDASDDTGKDGEAARSGDGEDRPRRRRRRGGRGRGRGRSGDDQEREKTDEEVAASARDTGASDAVDALDNEDAPPRPAKAAAATSPEPDTPAVAEAPKEPEPTPEPEAVKAEKAEPVASDEPWDPASFAVEPEEGKTRFHDIGLPDELLHSVQDLGFKFCTPIQAGILPEIMKGRDAVGQAQTGTGKTAAFLLRLYSYMLANPKEDLKPGHPRALILAPTRELAIQIEQEGREIGKYTGIRSLAVYGGMDYRKQQSALQRGPIELLVATPGRLLDFRRQQDINLGRVEVLVIDEADRMLDMGFIPDVRNIVYGTPKKEKRQTLFFSATFNDTVLKLADSWTQDAHKVEIEPDTVAADSVEQQVLLVTTEEKFAVVLNTVMQDNAERTLVFCNRRSTSRKLQEKLEDYGITVALLNGDVDQSKRLKTLEKFRSGEVPVVCATDVAGRGIHVDNVTHVINFDLPEDAEDYVHRIGRTGRAGAEGISISFATEDDAFALPDIEKYLGQPLKCVYPDEALVTMPPRPEGLPKRRRSSEGDRSGGRGRGGPRSGGGGRGGRGGSRSGGGGRSHSPRGGHGNRD